MKPGITLFLMTALFCGPVSIACTCVFPLPEHTNNEFTVELFDQFKGIAMIRIDSLKEDPDTQTIYTSNLINVQGNLPGNLTGYAKLHGSCSEKVEMSEIGDTMLLFLDYDTANYFSVSLCCFWESYKFIKFNKQKSAFLYDYFTGKKGNSITYYSNGNTTAKGSYNTAGEKQGYWEYYTFDGQVSAKGSFENGAKNGEWTEYLFFDNADNTYRNISYRTGRFESGTETGTWILYRPDGTLIGRE